MLDRELLDDSNIKRIEEISARLDFSRFVLNIDKEKAEMTTRMGIPILLKNLLKRPNVSCVEAFAEPGVISETHVHEEVEIVIVYEGSMEFTIGGSKFQITPGLCVYIPKNVPHSAKFTSDTVTKMICVTIPHSPSFPGEMDNGR